MFNVWIPSNYSVAPSAAVSQLQCFSCSLYYPFRGGPLPIAFAASPPLHPSDGGSVRGFFRLGRLAGPGGGSNTQSPVGAPFTRSVVNMPSSLRVVFPSKFLLWSLPMVRMMR